MPFDGIAQHTPQHAAIGCLFDQIVLSPLLQCLKRHRLIGETVQRRIRESLARGQYPPHDTVLGGLILLHGTKQGVPGQTSTNWTNGCIAMDNDDLAELLALYTADDRPALVIRP